ncbi:MmgE/PrpD family protein [Peribacillus sp. TH14]|uniref:MmgE/PrpD family protein n=1 Tax=Peribacillus sp. TH14 TaxID=2798481 RepID=UPI001912EF61|nr:MmgE/PrpD family protein [Peribacillus sp. TH14]MBK5502794.1 MmgE/PrpD family protein [Peribacillus sp. TH14]
MNTNENNTISVMNEEKGNGSIEYKNITERLAAHVANFRNIQLDELLVNQVKRTCLDYVCAAITGSNTEVSRLVYEYLLESEGRGTTNIIGRQTGLSKGNAAFLNGTSAHCLDMDDGHTGGSVHPATVVFPSVFAIAQHVKPTFDELAKSIVIGYDVCLRISSAIHPSSRQRGFHNTPVAGIFGSVAAASVLYGLKKEEVQNAFGIAGSFAGGIFAFLGTGSEVKRIHPGQATRDGITAVELTRKGLSGPKGVLEGENGLFQAFADGKVSIERMFRNIGEEYEIMNIYFKPHPCCRHLHSSIDAVYELKRNSPIRSQDIVEIRIGVNQIAYLHRHKDCQTLLDAQMSLPYAIAAAVYHPVLEVNHFQPEQTKETISRLAQLVEVYVDEEADQHYPAQRAARLEIKLKNSTTLTCYVENPLGEPSKPLTDEKLEEKFMANCSSIIGGKRAKSIVESIKNLEGNIDTLYSI